MSGGRSNNSNNNNRRSNRRRRGNKKATVKPEDFWGSLDSLPDEQANVRITTQPAAVVKSLGRAPLSGHHNVAEHYFTAVYDRSVALASALAAAGDLLAPSDEDA
ncbi:MAG: hypothetical protein AAF962_04565 [Actinomycetota bacterium]